MLGSAEHPRWRFWEPDSDAPTCGGCLAEFGLLRRRHHCRHCGYIFCSECSAWRLRIPLGDGVLGSEPMARVCLRCYETLSSALRDITRAQRAERGAERRRLLAELDCHRHCYQEAHTEVERLVRGGTLDLGMPLALPQIGTRGASGKSYHLCATKEQGRVLVCVVRLAEGAAAGPSRTSIAALRDFVRGLSHPFVHGLRELVPALGGRALVTVRDLEVLGSLKDRLHCECEPLASHSVKYRVGSRGRHWPLLRVRRLGKQILEALHYLRSMGLPCAHTHSGNVLLRSAEWCLLSEVELELSGLRPLEGVTVQLTGGASGRDGDDMAAAAAAAAAVSEWSSPPRNKIRMLASVWVEDEPEPAVAGFGHILYEMLAGGRQLPNNAPPTDTWLSHSMHDVFAIVFAPSNEADKTASLGRLTALCSHPMFADLSWAATREPQLLAARQTSQRVRCGKALQRVLLHGGMIQPQRHSVQLHHNQLAHRAELPRTAQQTQQQQQRPRHKQQALPLPPSTMPPMETQPQESRLPSRQAAAPKTVREWLKRVLAGYVVRGAPTHVIGGGVTATTLQQLAPLNGHFLAQPATSATGSELSRMPTMRFVKAAQTATEPGPLLSLTWVRSSGAEHQGTCAAAQESMPPQLANTGRWEIREDALFGLSIARSGNEMTAGRGVHGEGRCICYSGLCQPWSPPPLSGWSLVEKGESDVATASMTVVPMGLENYLSGLEKQGWESLQDVMHMTENDFQHAGVTDSRHRRLLKLAQRQIVWPLPSKLDEKPVEDVGRGREHGAELLGVGARVCLAATATAAGSAQRGGTLLRGGEVGVVVAVDDSDEEDVWCTVGRDGDTGGEGETDEYPRSALAAVTFFQALRPSSNSPAISKPSQPSTVTRPGRTTTAAAVDGQMDPQDQLVSQAMTAAHVDGLRAPAPMIEGGTSSTGSPRFGWQIQEQGTVAHLRQIQPTLAPIALDISSGDSAVQQHATASTTRFAMLHAYWAVLAEPGRGHTALHALLLHAHLQLGSPLGEAPAPAPALGLKPARRTAVRRALAALRQCGVTSKEQQRALLTEAVSLLRRLMRSQRCANAMRAQCTTGRLNQLVAKWGLPKGFVSALEVMLDSGVLNLTVTSLPVSVEHGAELLGVGARVCLAATATAAGSAQRGGTLLRGGEVGVVVAVDDSDEEDVWCTVGRDGDTGGEGETDEYPRSVLRVLAESAARVKKTEAKKVRTRAKMKSQTKDQPLPADQAPQSSISAVLDDGAGEPSISKRQGDRSSSDSRSSSQSSESETLVRPRSDRGKKRYAIEDHKPSLYAPDEFDSDLFGAGSSSDEASDVAQAPPAAGQLSPAPASAPAPALAPAPPQSKAKSLLKSLLDSDSDGSLFD
jgi:hypothetical protein